MCVFEAWKLSWDILRNWQCKVQVEMPYGARQQATIKCTISKARKLSEGRRVRLDLKGTRIEAQLFGS